MIRIVEINICQSNPTILFHFLYHSKISFINKKKYFLLVVDNLCNSCKNENPFLMCSNILADKNLGKYFYQSTSWNCFLFRFSICRILLFLPSSQVCKISYFLTNSARICIVALENWEKIGKSKRKWIEIWLSSS